MCLGIRTPGAGTAARDRRRAAVRALGLPAAAPVVPEGVAATGITSMLVNVARAPVVVVAVLV